MSDDDLAERVERTTAALRRAVIEAVSFSRAMTAYRRPSRRSCRHLARTLAPTALSRRVAGLSLRRERRARELSTQFLGAVHRKMPRRRVTKSAQVHIRSRVAAFVTDDRRPRSLESLSMRESISLLPRGSTFPPHGDRVGRLRRTAGRQPIRRGAMAGVAACRDPQGSGRSRRHHVGFTTRRARGGGIFRTRQASIDCRQAVGPAHRAAQLPDGHRLVGLDARVDRSGQDDAGRKAPARQRDARGAQSGIIAQTEELARSKDPAAERLFTADFVRGAAELLDGTFIDPDNLGIVDVMPASILNGVTPIPATGDASVDIPALIAAPRRPRRRVPHQRPCDVHADGAHARRGRGLPVPRSRTARRQRARAAVRRVALLPAYQRRSRDHRARRPGRHRVRFNDIRIDASRQASLQMDSAPTDPPTAATVMISLFKKT